jgi:hypothetical protein
VPHKQLTRGEAFAQLAQTPSRIAEITAGLTPAELQLSPGPGEWSANEVLAHLRACADVWGGSIATILATHTPTLRAVNPRTWIKDTDYPALRFRTSLVRFTEQREALLAVLQALSNRGWSRKAIVTGAGSPLEKTVLAYAGRMAVHERSHLGQFQRIAASVGSLRR